MVETAALFALCAAFLLALRDIFGRFGVRGVDPIVGAAVSALGSSAFSSATPADDA